MIGPTDMEGSGELEEELILISSGFLSQAHMWTAPPAERPDCPRAVISALAWASTGNGPRWVRAIAPVGSPQSVPQIPLGRTTAATLLITFPGSQQLLQNIVFFGGNITVFEQKIDSEITWQNVPRKDSKKLKTK